MKAKIVVRDQERIEPKVGTKLRTKARKAHTKGKSIFTIMQEMNTKKPVAREIRNFMEM